MLFTIHWSAVGQRFNAYWRPREAALPERIGDYPTLKRAKSACEQRARAK